MKYIKAAFIVFLTMCILMGCQSNNEKSDETIELQSQINQLELENKTLKEEINKLKEATNETSYEPSDNLPEEIIEFPNDPLEEITELPNDPLEEIAVPSDLALNQQDALFSDIETIKNITYDNPAELGQWVDSTYMNKYFDVFPIKICITDVKFNEEAELVSGLLFSEYNVPDVTNKRLIYIEYALALPDNFPLSEDNPCINVCAEATYSSAFKNGETQKYKSFGLYDSFISITNSKAGGVAYGAYFYALPKDSTEFTLYLGTKDETYIHLSEVK
ncbi:MAG: bZIP transcription factor [Herbinix sp.]|nr:bZIP transcription factor [Herbinix sp.]